MDEAKTTIETEENPLLRYMFEVGAQYGYKRSRRHPSVAPFIYGVKNRLEIFDLEQTADMLARALAFVETIAREGKQILFVGTKPEAEQTVRELAGALGMPFVTLRWIGGTLTNFAEIRGRVAHLEELRSKRESGEHAEKYTKKERLLIDRSIERLEKNFSGIAVMKEKPAALFIVDPRKEQTALREALQLRIPIIALAGSDCDVNFITYPIPANDASRSSIFFFIKHVADAYRKGRNEKPL